MTAKITTRDEPLIQEWQNCETASVAPDGAVWVEGPMAGHWLKPDQIKEYLAWRRYQLDTPVRWPADERLRQAGEALYGSRWQSELARALGVGDRRVREWYAGERRTPPGIWTDIAGLLRDRQQEIEAVLVELAEL